MKVVEDKYGVERWTQGEICIEVFGPDGKLKDRREEENLITTYGKEGIADQLLGSPSIGKPKYFAVGTSSTAAAAGDKKLGSQSGSRDEADEKVRSGKVVTMKVTYGPGEHTATLKEAGIFTESSGENCYSRVTFTEIEKGSEDTVVITWKYTIE